MNQNPQRIKKPHHFIMSGLFLLLGLGPVISQDALDPEIIDRELVYQIDLLREKQELPKLKRSEVLDAVAFDQAEYVADKGRIVHEQEKEQKKSLADRMYYYEALNAEGGENIAMLGSSTKAALEKGGAKVQLINEELLVAAAIHSWMEDEDSRLNLLDTNFYEIGVGINQSDNKEYVLVAVFASLPYQLPEGLKQKFNLHGLEAYNEEKCKTFDEKFATSPELFSDAFKLEENELFFEYHNFSLIEKMLENSSDGISAELISSDQYNCGESNRLFPGEVTDGYLMPIIRKGALSNLNLAEDQTKIKLKIGKIPQSFIDSKLEVNGMIIQDNAKCASIPYNQIEVENLRWLDLEFKMIELSDSASATVSDTLERRIYTDEFQSLIDFLGNETEQLKQLGFSTESIRIIHFQSPLAKEVRLQDSLLIKRLREASKLDEALGLEIKSKVDWESYDDYQSNTYLEIETKGFDRSQVRDHLELAVEKDAALSSFLDSLNRFELVLIGKFELDKKISIQDIPERFPLIKKLGSSMLSLHHLNQYLNSENVSVKGIKMIRSELEQNSEDLELINNLIVAASKLGEDQFDGNDISTAFLECKLVMGKEPIISYNYHLAVLKDWAMKQKAVSQAEKWEDGFERLKSRLNPNNYARTFLNYHMIMADHYYDKQKAEAREDSFEEIMDWIPRSGLSQAENLALAKYLAYQDQFDRAISLLLSEVKKGQTSSELLMYFLQIAIYDSEEVRDDLYLESMQKAAADFTKDFCNLFSEKRMGFQRLKDAEVKKLYCKSCVN